jgi:hypothetical protein
MDISSPNYQWHTPCGQLLQVSINETGELVAELVPHSGIARPLSKLAFAHLQQWYHAELRYLELTQTASERFHHLQGNMEQRSAGQREEMRTGLSSFYDEMHRTRINAANMKHIREVTLQRVLLAADKEMMAESQPSGHRYAPVASLGHEKRLTKTAH